MSLQSTTFWIINKEQQLILFDLERKFVAETGLVLGCKTPSKRLEYLEDW